MFTRGRHDESVRYAVYVLWMIGYSQGSISTALRLRRKQIAGMIQNSGEYRDRASMSDRQRAAGLAELRAIRLDEGGEKLDGGILDPVPFRIRPLDGRQRRRKAAES